MPEDSGNGGYRFGCGFVVGLFVGGVASLGIIGETFGVQVTVTITIAFLFGLAAFYFRDSFWRWFSFWFGWFK